MSHRLLLLLITVTLLPAQMVVPGETEQLFKDYYEDPPPPRDRKPQPVPIDPPKPETPDQKRSDTEKSTLPQFSEQTFLGIPVEYFGGIRLGWVEQNREVQVRSNNSGDTITRKDTGEVIGTADGTTHSYTEKNSYDRSELQLGVGHINTTGRYTRVQFHTSNEIHEFALISGKRFENRWVIEPYLEGMFLIGYNQPTDLFPTDFGIGLEIGLLYRLGRKLDLEVGAGYKLRRWRPVDKDYGQEYWIDRDLQTQVGLRYPL